MLSMHMCVCVGGVIINVEQIKEGGGAKYVHKVRGGALKKVDYVTTVAVFPGVSVVPKAM